MGQSKHEIINPYFADSSKDYIYKADIALFKKNFSGICIVKKIEENRHRVVFTTEMGNKIFDFLISADDFQVNYIFPEMDKKMVITMLKEDFSILTTEKPFCNATFGKNQETLFQCKVNKSQYYYHSVGEGLHKIVKSRNGAEKVVFLFAHVEDNYAGLIKIVHNQINLDIVLKAI